MGNYSDPAAVVDPELRVYGISGLRVADASIMPNVVSGNTNAPVVNIQQLNKTWNLKNSQSNGMFFFLISDHDSRESI